ncbi:MAG: hypothetical protein GX154_05275 [Clostridiales bacterium]|nr:hypothetical protein [Clostridiales bacterium]
MYRIFCESLDNFFAFNKDAKDGEYRLKIAQPLKALSDIGLYNEWKVKNTDKHKEVNNLIYEINKNINKYPTFSTFSSDLKGYGYESRFTHGFDREVIEEQLKLIDTILKLQYWN